MSSDTDAVTIPYLPIVHQAIALLARERGETGGTTSAEYFAIANKYLSDAIAYDSYQHPEEFRQLYGINPTNETFVTKLYDNVLDRTPDQGGYDYWVGHLNAGINSKEQVLCSLSESPENMLNFDNQVTLI